MPLKTQNCALIDRMSYFIYLCRIVSKTLFFKLGESVFSSFVRAAVKSAGTTNASARRADK